MPQKMAAMGTSSKIADGSLETISSVVEAVYDCALDPNRWRHTIHLIADLCESQRCALSVHDYANGRNDIAFLFGYQDESYWRLHEEKCSLKNPLFARLQLLPLGAVATLAMLIDENEFVETRYYQEWFKPQRLRDVIAMIALQTEQRIGLLETSRSEDHPRYGDREVRLLTLLSPHVCRSIAISGALNLRATKSEALEAALNALTTSVYLTDDQGRVVFMNYAAEHQVRTKKALRIASDRLVPVDRAARHAMSRAIAEAVAHAAATPASGMTLALPAGKNTGLFATILPLNRVERRSLGVSFAAKAAIVVQDPIIVPPFPGEAFAKLYGLTGGELRVLLVMAPGLCVKEAAEVLGIRETTARTHLQHIHAKTGTSKQTELMNLLKSSTPPVLTH